MRISGATGFGPGRLIEDLFRKENGIEKPAAFGQPDAT
jgi:hypothetical protein